MRNNFLRSFVALTTMSLVLALAGPSFAQSQWDDRDRYRDRNPRVDVDRLIRQAEMHSDQFVAALEQSRDRGLLERVFGGGERLNGLAARAHDLESQFNSLREESSRSDNFYDLRSGVAVAMSVAEGINNSMRNRRLNYEVERQWSMLRADLNRLARVYNLRQLG